VKELRLFEKPSAERRLHKRPLLLTVVRINFNGFRAISKTHNIKSFSILPLIASSIAMLCLSQGTQRLRVTACCVNAFCYVLLR